MRGVVWAITILLGCSSDDVSTTCKLDDWCCCNQDVTATPVCDERGALSCPPAYTLYTATQCHKVCQYRRGDASVSDADAPG